MFKLKVADKGMLTITVTGDRRTLIKTLDEAKEFVQENLTIEAKKPVKRKRKAKVQAKVETAKKAAIQRSIPRTVLPNNIKEGLTNG